MKVFFEVIFIIFSIKYGLMVKNDCYGNLLNYVFFIVLEKIII